MVKVVSPVSCCRRHMIVGEVRYPERLCCHLLLSETTKVARFCIPIPHLRNLRPKTSAAFWAGATRGWSARDAPSRQSRTVPVAGVRAVTTSTSDAKKEAGDYSWAPDEVRFSPVRVIGSPVPHFLASTIAVDLFCCIYQPQYLNRRRPNCESAVECNEHTLCIA